LKYIFYVVKRIAAGSHPEPVAMYYENSEMSFRRKKQNRNC